MADADSPIAALLAEQRRAVNSLNIVKHQLISGIEFIAEQIRNIDNIIAEFATDNAEPADNSASNPVDHESIPEIDHSDESINKSRGEVQFSDGVSTDENALDENEEAELEMLAMRHHEQRELRKYNNKRIRESDRCIRPDISFLPEINFPESGDSQHDDPEWNEDSYTESTASDVEEGEGSDDEMDHQSDDAGELRVGSSQEDHLFECRCALKEPSTSRFHAEKASQGNISNQNDPPGDGRAQSRVVEDSLHSKVHQDCSEGQGRIVTDCDDRQLVFAPKVVEETIGAVYAANNAHEAQESKRSVHEVGHSSIDEQILNRVKDNNAQARDTVIEEEDRVASRRSCHHPAKQSKTAMKAFVSGRTNGAQALTHRDSPDNGHVPLKESVGSLQGASTLSTPKTPKTPKNATKRPSGSPDKLGPRKQLKLQDYPSDNNTSDSREFELAIKEVFEAQGYCEAFAHGGCCGLQHVGQPKLEELLSRSNITPPLRKIECENLEALGICTLHVTDEYCKKVHKTSNEIFELLHKADEDLAAYYASSLINRDPPGVTGAAARTMHPLIIDALKTSGICVKYYSAKYHGVKGHCDELHVPLETAKLMIAMPDAHPSIRKHAMEALGICRVHLKNKKSKTFKPCCDLPHPDPSEMMRKVDRFIRDYRRGHPTLQMAVHSRTRRVLKALRAC